MTQKETLAEVLQYAKDHDLKLNKRIISYLEYVIAVACINHSLQTNEQINAVLKTTLPTTK